MLINKYVPNIELLFTVASTACGSPATPPPPPTPAPPPNPCGSPQWFGDNYCDDENNNAECGWDGGDCCGDNVNTQYCSACECLDPNGGGEVTTAAPSPTTAAPSPTTAAPSPPASGDCGMYVLVRRKNDNMLTINNTIFYS